MSDIEKTVFSFSQYLQDPDFIKNKTERVKFEKSVIRIKNSIGKRFFGLFSRALPIEEMTSYYACELLYYKVAQLLNEEGYLLIRDNLKYKSDVKTLFGVFISNTTYCVLLCHKLSATEYSLEIHFRKKFSSKEVTPYYERFVRTQGIENPLSYLYGKSNSEVFLKEFMRRLKLYSGVSPEAILPKESGLGRFLKTFDDEDDDNTDEF